jgi:hypothetical protein
VNATWKNFARRHSGHPFLECDPLYSLPIELIEAIETKLPDFFAAGQAEFEKDLARTASFGFFRQRALGVTRAVPGQESLEDRHARSARQIETMLREGYRLAGLTQDQIDDHFRREADDSETVETRQGAYVGWLVTNRRFRAEVRKLRDDWEPLVSEVGLFPTSAHWLDTEARLGRRLPRECRRDFSAFYDRWSLLLMLTWDWPVPLGPLLTGLLTADLLPFGDAGLVLFVPWYLLRGEKLNLQAVAQNVRQVDTPEHLRPWVQRQSDHGGDRLGDFRYERTAWLYRFRELALNRRYRPACRRRTEKLDGIVGELWGRDVDTVKKIRLGMRRAIGDN